MLLHFSFSNFQSFYKRTEVDFRLNRKTHLTDLMVETLSGERVSKLMTVIGPNASGKTSLLKPLVFLNSFMTRSFFQYSPQAVIPIFPHFSAINEPTEFELLFNFGKEVWRYELCCTQQRVLHEALYQKHDRFAYVFIRDWNEAKSQYTIKQKDFGFIQKEANKVRANASLISTAAQYDVPIATYLVKMLSLHSNINVFGREPLTMDAVHKAAAYFSTKPKQCNQMTSLLSAWDLGLSTVEVREFDIPLDNNTTTKIWRPFGVHKSKHSDYRLAFEFESRGTQSAFVLLSQLLPALEDGGLAVVDEFENDLHPHMLEPILDLFANPSTNPHDAQLLFTCHAIEVINLLDKAQVMLVEKNTDCESSACRLDDVDGIRSDDNFYAKYMAGVYGAVPNF